MPRLPTPRESIPYYESKWLELIPDTEATIFKAYYLVGLRQTEIAALLGVKQAAVSYLLKRCQQRFDFLELTPLLNEKEIREILSPIFEEDDLTILVSMGQTTCQSLTARHLGLNQGKVRFRFLKAVERLKELTREDTSYFPCYRMFSAISESFNILKAVGPRTSPEGLARLAQLLPPLPSPPMEQQTPPSEESPPSEEQLLKVVQEYVEMFEWFESIRKKIHDLFPGHTDFDLMAKAIKVNHTKDLSILRPIPSSENLKEAEPPVAPLPAPKSNLTFLEAVCKVMGAETLHVSEILDKLEELGAAPNSKNPRNSISSNLSYRKDVFEKLGGGYWRRLDPNVTPPPTKPQSLKAWDKLAADLGVDKSIVLEKFKDLSDSNKLCLNSYYQLTTSVLTWKELGKRHKISPKKMADNLEASITNLRTAIQRDAT